MIKLKEGLTEKEHEEALDWIGKNGYYQAQIGNEMGFFKLDINYILSQFTEEELKKMSEKEPYIPNRGDVSYIRGGYGSPIPNENPSYKSLNYNPIKNK